MNDQPESENSSKATGDQMDGLLTAFFDHEVPAQLSVPPSKWLQNTPQSPAVARPVQRRRAIGIVGALAAACLLFFVVANPFDKDAQGPDSQTAKSENTTETPTALDQDATFNVSSGNPEGAVDDANTTLEEIDSIDLTPKPQDDDRQKQQEQ